MPEGKRFDEVVVGEGAWYADTYLKKFNLGPGHNILIYGASGAIGTSVVRIGSLTTLPRTLHRSAIPLISSWMLSGKRRSSGADRF